MSRSDQADCGRLLRTACTNVIGFWQLLQDPDSQKLDPVKRMQYRAYIIGCALHLADLVVQHEDAMADLYPQDWEPDLTGSAREFRELAYAFDGDCQDELDEQALAFSQNVLCVFIH
ncbi:hypothetical protein [Roseibium sediminicola]|uniref:Uncharacterized protein n=1 Tax=Roseibium sediminicola TaxID=2933272 RepID=A0ABT0H4W3_9HYPH|nr:hypothetical protein [Roseibium sp. CAU 1639]MCK7616123.1 hypothetical protein [Roseibium sp. CAU 1639]